MINKLLCTYIGINKLDDRDSYINKRLDSAGVLIGGLLNQCIIRISREMNQLILKEINSGIWNINKQYDNIINEINICKIIKSSYIETVLKMTATGNWGLKG